MVKKQKPKKSLTEESLTEESQTEEPIAEESLGKLLKIIHENICNEIDYLQGFDSSKLQIILVSYRKTSDSIIFWDLYPRIPEKVGRISKMNIKNGAGTVGFILRSKSPEVVGDTFDDPRGSVAFEDIFIGNLSWYGIPVFQDKTKKELKFIISFSYNERDFWSEKFNKKYLVRITQEVINKYEEELKLLNELKLNKNILEVFLNGSSHNNSLLNRLLMIVDETVSYSFLTYSRNNQIDKIKLNDSIIEGNIFTFLNWCSLFNVKCDSCPIEHTNTPNKNCNYCNDFLNHLQPYKCCELFLDSGNLFSLRLYYTCNEDKKITLDAKLFHNVFNPLISLYIGAGKEIEKKIIVEIIHQILDHYTEYLINNEDSKIDEKLFAEYSEIINSYFKKETPLIKAEFDGIFKILKEEIKQSLLFIEFWRNNMTGIKINNIKYKEENYQSAIETLNIDKQLRETGTIKVLILPELIPKKNAEHTIKYKPLITANESRTIYKTELQQYVITDNNEELCRINWEESPCLSQLIRVKLNPINIEKLFINNEVFKSSSNLQKNRFFGFTKNEIIPDQYDKKLEIDLAVNSDVNPDTLNKIGKFCENIFESELKLNASTLAAISQVMARNMSHNIGSHVMSNFTGTQFYNNFHYCDTCSQTTALDAACTDPKCTLKSYIGLNKITFPKGVDVEIDKDKLLYFLSVYNEYIRTRMEYISDISFGEPVMTTNKKLMGEIFNPFDENRLLLNYISGINDFKYCFKVQYNGNDLSNNGKLELAMPNDVLGHQALYNIIENFIRNTAKHNQGKADDDERITFTLNIKDIPGEDEYYQVEIYDNIPVIKDDSALTKEENKETREKIKEYFGIESDVNITKLQSLVYDLNSKLNGSILEPNTHRVRDNSLGIMEMEASACYLRMMDVSEIESDNYSLRDKITAYDSNLKNAQGKYNILRSFIKDGKHLGYTFFLLKPKDYLMVEFDGEMNEFQGVNFVSKKDLMNDLLRGKKFRHQFIVFNNQADIEKINVKIEEQEHFFNHYKNQLPYRWLTVNDENDCIHIKLNAAEKTELDNCIWDKWWEKVKGVYEHINVFTSYQEFGHNQKYRFNICFVNHDDGIQNRINEYKKGESNFLDALSSKGLQSLPDFTGQLSNYKTIGNKLSKITKYKLFESSNAKVMILDERVQRLFETENYLNQPYKLLYGCANIFVPFLEVSKPDDNKEYCKKYLKCDATCSNCNIDLGSKNFDDQLIEKIKDFIENLKADYLDIIVIHYSILERMNLLDNKKGGNMRENENLKNFIASIQCKCKKIVITSGRGKPKEIAEINAGFVNLSSLLNAVHIVRSKYLLFQLLTNSRN